MTADELVRDHGEALRRVCERIVGVGDADDIVQETLIRAIAHRPDASGPVWPWLLTVARNLAFNHVRRARRTDLFDEVVAPDVPEQEPAPSPERIAADRARGADAVLTAIEILSPTERNVVFLRELIELTPAETASVLGLTPASVRVLHSRARVSLARRATRARAEGEAPIRSSVAALEQFVAWSLSQVVERDQPINHLVGTLEGHLALVDAVLERARACGQPSVLAGALLCRGNVHRLLARYALAERDLSEGIDAAERAGDLRLVARGRARLAATLVITSGTRRALAELDLVLGGSGVDPTDRVLARTLRAYVLLIDGRIDDARAEVETAERDLPPTAATRDRMLALGQRGLAHLFARRYQRAIADLGDTAAVARELGDTRRFAAVCTNLGVAFLGAGDLATARRVQEVAIESARTCGDERLRGMALANLADVLVDADDLVGAASAYAAAIAIHVAVGNARGRAITAFNAAVCEATRGDPEGALVGMRAAEAELREIGHAMMYPYALAFRTATEVWLGVVEPGRLAEAFEDASLGDPAWQAARHVLLGLVDLRRGDRPALQARLLDAETRFVEVRTAIRMVQAAMQRDLNERRLSR